MPSIFTDTILNIGTHNRVMFVRSSRAPSAERKRNELHVDVLCGGVSEDNIKTYKYGERISAVEKCCEF
jgi:hypothetical protein